MTTNSYTGLKQLCFPIGIRGIEQRPDIELCFLGECREFIGQGDVDVPIYHARELDKRSRLHCTDVNNRRSQPSFIECNSCSRARCV